ncbi:hypothetical protein BGZ50_003867 [Haplosporangium sp. Z 11]|nr:hypothetical protein BGZ50_003867 [Haplosporangium sp. Z 11]
MHLLQQNSIRARDPPPHHQRFFCLHHDQLMTGTTVPNSAVATALTSGLVSPDSTNRENRIDREPMITVGSKHLAVDYRTTVMECHRCLFCVTSPCKANLEIKIKFYQLRVSLDWILSGFVPDQGQRPQHPQRQQSQYQFQI